MSRVVEINDIDQLAGHQLLWNALWTRTPDASFFHSLAWLGAYWSQVVGHQQLRILIAYAGGEPIGIVPLTLVREKTKLGCVHVLTYPKCPGGHFFGPIGPHPAATLTLAMRHIERTARRWQGLDLRPIDAQGRDRGRTPLAMKMAGLHVRQSIWAQAAVVEIDGTWDAYLAGREPRFRETLLEMQQTLNRSGSVQHVRYRPFGSRYGDDDPRWDLYDMCAALGRGGAGHGQNRSIHRLAVKRGALDLNLLLHQGRPVAFCYGFHRQGQVHVVREGAVSHPTDFAAGLALRAGQIQDSFRRGDRAIHFGRRDLQQEGVWFSRLVPAYRYTHFPVGATSGLSRLTRWFR